MRTITRVGIQARQGRVGGGLIHVLSVLVYRPAGGAGLRKSQRLRLGGKRFHQQKAQLTFAFRDER